MTEVLASRATRARAGLDDEDPLALPLPVPMPILRSDPGNGNSKWDAEVAAVIARRVSLGETLRQVCRTKGMPDESTVRLWAINDVCGFGLVFAQARELQAHSMAEGNPTTDLRVSAVVLIPATELSWRFSRSSGPGGQNVNSTDTRVELVFSLVESTALPAMLKARALGRLAGRLVDGTLVIAASEHRSQWQNRVAAQRRLLGLLKEAIAPPAPPRRRTKPTRGSVERRLAAKKQRSAIKGQRRGRTGSPED